MISFFQVAPTFFQVVLLVIAVVAIAIMVPRTVGELILRRGGVATAGQVSRVHHGTMGEANAATISFVDAKGATHSFRSYLPLRADRSFVGAPASVIYDPADPQRARELGQPIYKSITTVLIYALIVAALLIAFIHPLALAFTSGN